MNKAMFARLDDEEIAATNSKPDAGDGWAAIMPVPKDAPRQIPPHTLGKPSARWGYKDGEGRLLFAVCRFDTADGGKEFLPLSYGHGDGKPLGWHWKAVAAPRPLYGLERLAARPDAPVLVVEGEKVADTVAEIFPNFVAITTPGGSKAAGKADWSPLQGRDVSVWPDNDSPGTDYSQDAARLASESQAARVRIVNVPDGFPEKWDLADAPPDGWDANRLRELLEAARPWEVDEPEAAPAGDEALLAELAALPRIEYDRRREDSAKRLGVRVPTLDAEVAERRPAGEEDEGSGGLFADPEPWPAPVDGAALLDALAAAFTRYVILPVEAADALALWVVFAHAHDAAYVSPIMAVTSPLKRCGKTTCLGIIQALVPRALPTANITAAALFRTVEKWEPTVIIDEADTFLRDNDELRGVLNSGHVRGSGGVIRTVGDNHEPRRFSTWAPKAIALIGALPDTLADRSIHVRLRRKRPDEIVERVRLDRMDDLIVLKRQAARWAADNLDALRRADPDVPVGLHDRAADNWRTILSIADLAGGGWPGRARVTAKTLSSDVNDDASAKVMLLTDIRALFAERHTDRITSVDLAAALVAMEERPWPEWKRGKPITPTGVARLLADFQIRPKVFRVDVRTTAKGYLLDAFKDTFSQYIPVPTVTRSQPNETGAYSENPSVTPPPNVTDENGRKPAEHKECYRVTDEKGGAGEKWGMEL